MTMLSTVEITTVPKRAFLPDELSIRKWADVEVYFDELLKRSVNDATELNTWLHNRSELEAVLEEDLGWRYIRMSCDTSNESLANEYTFFISEIQPQISQWSNLLDQKLIASPSIDQLTDTRIHIMIRQIKKRIEIFREINVPLIAEMQQMEQQFAAISGAMTVEVVGKELTLQQAGNYLEQEDRAKREEVYRAICERRNRDRNKLDQLFNELVAIRHQIALNAGFDNFRDYMFASLGRFDYNADDCLRFHKAVEQEVVPLVAANEKKHQKSLGLEVLRPWDQMAEPTGSNPLRPFANAEEIMDRTIACFNQLDPFLGSCLQTMKEAGRVDLESRKGKAPGGYNYPLYESGMPFIFMNSTNTLRDLVTIVHEGGHAVQSILDKPLDFVDFKSLPSEVAELASMSMELMSMEHWDHFFIDKIDLNRARKKHLEDVLKGLPWIAAVDAFQHWIYLHPQHTVAERSQEWNNILDRFSGNVVNWEGLEDIKSSLWHRQLHIFEVPFYYIEYGFAQLGAIAVWRNFKKEPKDALSKYLKALSLGYTDSIPNIYSTAGVSFEFSADYVRELCAFVREEMELMK